MPYTNDVSPVSEHSYKDFTQTTFDVAETEGYVAGVVAGALVGLSDKLVTLTNGTQYTVRFANKLVELGEVSGDTITWTNIGLAEYTALQGVPDVLAVDNTVIATWSVSDTVYIYVYVAGDPLPSVYSFDGISSALAYTVQFNMCCVYIGLDGAIHIMKLGEGTWISDHTMSADLADDTIRIARAFVSTSTEFVTERLALLMLRVSAGLPDYFYMVSNIEPYNSGGGGGIPGALYDEEDAISLSFNVENLMYCHQIEGGWEFQDYRGGPYVEIPGILS